MDAPRVQYVKNEDGASIAYATLGAGREMVHVPTAPLSHILKLREVNAWTHEAWASHFIRITLYDAHGSGMSDRSNKDFSLDALLRDLRAVIGRVASGPVALVGAFDAVPVAIAYAARHPEDVSALALNDGWTRWSDQDAKPARAAERALRGQDWTLYTETVARVLLGETFGDNIVPALARYIRDCVDQQTMAAYYEAYEGYDVTECLALVQAPTLVLYNPHNSFTTAEASQRIAGGIPNAEFRLFDDRTYSSIPAVVAEWLGIEAATPATGGDSSGQRSDLRTVLFTDLVGHTEMMSRLGDAKGRDVLREHERITREVLKANGGTEVKTMGDGFMASFGSVTRAVECAIALQRAFAEREGEPLNVRVGLNAGEPIEKTATCSGRR